MTQWPTFWRTSLAKALSTKFLLTAGSLTAVFALAYHGTDVSKLEVIVPAILIFYNGPNVMQDWVNRKKEKSNGSVDNDLQSH